MGRRRWFRFAGNIGWSWWMGVPPPSLAVAGNLNVSVSKDASDDFFFQEMRKSISSFFGTHRTRRKVSNATVSSGESLSCGEIEVKFKFFLGGELLKLTEGQHAAEWKCNNWTDWSVQRTDNRPNRSANLNESNQRSFDNSNIEHVFRWIKLFN